MSAQLRPPAPRSASPTAAASEGPLQALQRVLDVPAIALPPRRSGYRHGMLLVVAFCLAIPVFYVGLIAALAAGLVGWYRDWVPGFGQGWPALLVALAWVLPGTIGPVLLAFLLKPLIAVPARPESRPTLLHRYEEPAFFEAVDLLCRALRVAPPVAIEVDLDANASVSYQHGLSGLLRGRRVLTIGLPLVMAMSSRQLVGVLAHEFGHFAQRAGGVGRYFVNSINDWLYQRAHGHDRWDERLAGWMEEDAPRHQVLVVGLTRLALQGVRLLLRGLFELSFRASSRFSRDLEFDADRYETALAGSACHRDTALRLRAARRALEAAHQANVASWREGRLVDDLPGAAEDRLRQFGERDWREIADAMQGEWETRYWDSHPPSIERIDAAEESATPGLFLDERPARELFRDAATLCRRATLDYYTGLGLKPGVGQLVSVDAFASRLRNEDALAEALAGYGNGLLDARWPPSPREAAHPAVGGLAWQQTIDQLRRLLPRAAGLWSRLERRREQADDLDTDLMLIDAGFDVVDDHGAPCDAAELRRKREALGAEDADDKLLRVLLALTARRLQCAIDAMLGEQRDLALQRWRLLQQLADLSPRCEALVRRRYRLLSMDYRLGAEAAHRREERLQGFADELEAFLLRAEGVPLPEHGTLARHLRGRSQAGDPLAAAAGLGPAFLRLQRNLLGELALQAMQAEQRAGILPIKLLSAARS
jgi:Zn-dependent protease with chaperone function